MENVNAVLLNELMLFETGEAVETLKKCGITEGMTVLDMGCGFGQWSYPAAIIVGPKGRVIAVDSEKEAKNVLEHVADRAKTYKLENITCLKPSASALYKYTDSVDFIMLYDVFHSIYNYGKKDWGVRTKDRFVDSLAALLKSGGILSFAAFSEIDYKLAPKLMKNGKYCMSPTPITHTEAVQPYLSFFKESGLKLSNVVENGGVHFDFMYMPNDDYGDIKVSSLERRNIYNFTKSK